MGKFLKPPILQILQIRISDFPRISNKLESRKKYITCFFYFFTKEMRSQKYKLQAKPVNIYTHMSYTNIYLSKGLKLDFRCFVMLLMRAQSSLNIVGKFYFKVCPNLHCDLVVTEALKLR